MGGSLMSHWLRISYFKTVLIQETKDCALCRWVEHLEQVSARRGTAAARTDSTGSQGRISGSSALTSNGHLLAPSPLRKPSRECGWLLWPP